MALLSSQQGSQEATLLEKKSMPVLHHTPGPELHVIPG